MTEFQGYSSFATRLTGMREARNLSQKELAARLGCDPSLISKYETGRQVPRTPEIYLQLSATLAVSPGELLGAPPALEPADPRLAVRVRALVEGLAPEQLAAVLDFLDAALAMGNGGLPLVLVAPRQL